MEAVANLDCRGFFFAVDTFNGNKLDLVILDTSSCFFRLGAKYASCSCRGVPRANVNWMNP